MRGGGGIKKSLLYDSTAITNAYRMMFEGSDVEFHTRTTSIPAFVIAAWLGDLKLMQSRQYRIVVVASTRCEEGALVTEDGPAYFFLLLLWLHNPP